MPEGNLELGSALIVATAAPDGEPRAARASSWSVVDPAARRVRLAVSADDPVMVATLHQHAERDVHLAVTGADVATLRSLQLKGRVVAVDDPDPADLDLSLRHQDLFVAKIEATDGHPRDVVWRFLPASLIMVEMLVEEAYDQTPGPEAGAALRAASR